MFSWMHPYYISMTEIEHDKTNNTLEISVRIFTDDLEKTIRKTYTGKVDLLNKDEKSNFISYNVRESLTLLIFPT